jgi:glutathione S-transferase
MDGLAGDRAEQCLALRVHGAGAQQPAAHQDQVQVEASIEAWNRHMGILERQLERTGGFAAGGAFSLADIVLGLSANRWLMTPMEPGHPAIGAWLERLAQQPGFHEYCRNGNP